MEEGMCMTCGCGEPNDKHGDEASITNDELISAANAAGVSEKEAIDNIARTYREKIQRAA
jgi:hypothetical protein